MSELIYLLTVLFSTYVVYTAEGDQIVAFIKEKFNIDLSHPHQCCTDAINRAKAMLKNMQPGELASFLPA